jgi:hypothetical protein
MIEEAPSDALPNSPCKCARALVRHRAVAPLALPGDQILSPVGLARLRYAFTPPAAPGTFTTCAPATPEVCLRGCLLRPEVPLSVFLLEKLQRLSLAGNGLTGVPAQISRLAALEELDLSCNHLAAIPLVVLTLPSLARLSLAGNWLRQLEPGFGGATTFSQSVREVRLEGNRWVSVDARQAATRLLQQKLKGLNKIVV